MNKNISRIFRKADKPISSIGFDISFYSNYLFIFVLIIYLLILIHFNYLMANSSKKILVKYKYLTRIVTFFVNKKAS